MRANTCGFPAVKKTRMIKTRRSIRNEQSTISRNVGWREEPGCKMVEKKDSDALSGAGVVCGMPMAMTSLVRRQQRRKESCWSTICNC
jgi:hypothetical protein